MRLVLIGLAGLTLAGCATTVSEPGQAVPAAANVPGIACTSGRADSFIGRSAETFAQEARLAAGAKTVRVIAPNQAVTQDFRADRLNLHTNTVGVVIKTGCG